MTMTRRSNPNAQAWLLLVVALLVHVVDEALTGFLPFYNETVGTLRERWGIFPMPQFTFVQWISGLAIGLFVGFAATPLVARGGAVIRWVTLVIGILMVGNGLGHMLGSLYAGRPLPGLASAPLVLGAAGYVVWRAASGDWSRAGQNG